MNAPVDYDAVRTELKTGDVVLFSGRGLVSAVIRKISRSKWSHVGMILRTPLVGGQDLILVWESTTLSKVKDAVDGYGKKGVQLVLMSRRVATYPGTIAIRRLRHEVSLAAVTRLLAFREEVKGRPYEKHIIELVKSAYDGWGGGNIEDLSSLFCSELIAEAYQRMGFLSEDVPSNEYTPADFARTEGTLAALLGPVIELVPAQGSA